MCHQVLTAIKNKLRFKPEGLYSLGGEHVDWRRALDLGTVVVTRKGESFVGAVRPVDVVDPGVADVAVVGAHLVSPEAVDQLRTAAAMPYVRVAAGMPDLHVGIPVPVGPLCLMARGAWGAGASGWRSVLGAVRCMDVVSVLVKGLAAAVRHCAGVSMSVGG